MTRSALIVPMLLACGAAADINMFNRENHQAIEREQHESVNPIARRAVMLAVDSGVVRAPAPAADARAKPQQVAVWSTEIEVPDAAWVRLQFGDVTLAPATATARESYLRITSLYDGHEQYLDRQSLSEWSFTSAYFNGGRIRIEIMASPDAAASDNRVTITGASASEPTAFPRSICGTVDDRSLSSDPRAARLMPVGCTVWLFGNQPNSFLTAGHCGPAAGDVVQFNVPLSSAGGTPQNPGPQDQYPVDGTSPQMTSGTIGADWAFFGAFNNSNTGLAPADAMGDSYTLTPALPPMDGRPIRISGYGSTTSPVSPTWYLVQKTHVGPFNSISGNILRYTTDTTGGNSGSAILDENNNLAIGIHTHAGCTTSGGANQGTSLFNAGLQAALANPQGITIPAGLDMTLLTTRPEFISPTGGDTITVQVLADNGLTPSGSVTMFVDSGSGFAPVPMTAAGANAYTGTFPPAACGQTVRYYFAAGDTASGTSTLPTTGAAGAYSTLAAAGVNTVIADSFQTNLGWTVANTAVTTGAWARAIPGNFGRSDPASDFDGSGLCYVTGNTSSEDLDGGPTILTSPLIDITTLSDPTVTYARWHRTNGDDVLEVQVSANNGASWVTVESVGDNAAWIESGFRVADYVSTGGTLRVRFISSDNPNTYITESGVDAFRVFDISCDAPCTADLDGNGELNFFDISAYLGLYNAGSAQADLDNNGELNFFDVSAYLAAYAAGCP